MTDDITLPMVGLDAPFIVSMMLSTPAMVVKAVNETIRQTAKAGGHGVDRVLVLGNEEDERTIASWASTLMAADTAAQVLAFIHHKSHVSGPHGMLPNPQTYEMCLGLISSDALEPPFKSLLASLVHLGARAQAPFQVQPVGLQCLAYPKCRSWTFLDATSVLRHWNELQAAAGALLAAIHRAREQHQEEVGEG